ncbi:MAG: tetratricopeptide repeat protein [Methylococcales bacterium]|nr:tetratricopeptide repeat protein [Methylococcales bacterium]
MKPTLTDYQQVRHLLQAGRQAEAASLYARLLKAQPKNALLLFEAGGLALQQGRPEQAVNLFARLVKQQPDHADAWCNLGQAHARLGRYQQALEAYRQAVAIRPDFAGAYYNIAMAEQAQGRLAEALAAYDRAIALQPGFAEAHNNRGNVLNSFNRFEEALQSFDQSLSHWPENLDAWYNHGLTLQALGRHGEAVHSFRRALALRPDHVEAGYRCALCFDALQDARQALACLDQVVRLQPGRAEAHALRGRLLHTAGGYAQAIVSYRQAVQLGLASADLLTQLAKALLLDRQYQQALPVAEQAAALDPGFAPAHNIRGAALHFLQQHQQALSSLQQAISLYPRDEVFYNNQALVLQELRRFPEAHASYDQALRLNPDYADGWWNKSLLHLLLGEFEPGWRLYEWRWRTESQHEAPAYTQPLWLGETALTGQRLLVSMEQGQGDFIQFCRYLPLLAAATQVILQTPASLLGLAATLSADNLLIVPHGQPLPDFDYYCPLLSLPLALSTTLNTVPALTPYLRADPEKVRLLRRTLPSAAWPRVGLVWSGSTGHSKDHLRSMPFAQLLPLLDLPFEFHVLQKDIREPDQRLLEKINHPRLHSHQLEDFGDTAALLEAMDLLLSVDTSVAHLAGALARPFWLLLPYTPDYRWLLDRPDSPWYPNARLFRQTSPGDWPGVVAAVRQALAALALPGQP